MNAQFLYNMALLLHITGFTLLVGATLSAYLCMHRLWKLDADKAKGAGDFMKMSSGLSALAIIGGVLVIGAGASMIALILRAGPVEPQRWFQIKIILVLLIVLNITLFGTRQARKLKKVLKGGQLGISSASLDRIRSSLNLFYAIQLLLMFTIFVLSTFRFQ